jgi:hypothetical protein
MPLSWWLNTVISLSKLRKARTTQRLKRVLIIKDWLAHRPDKAQIYWKHACLLENLQLNSALCHLRRSQWRAKSLHLKSLLSSKSWNLTRRLNRQRKKLFLRVALQRGSRLATLRQRLLLNLRARTQNPQASRSLLSSTSQTNARMKTISRTYPALR